MQGFQVSAAKHLNAIIGKARGGRRRRGTVFPDRYHAEIITSPTQARHTISYILSNWRHHQEDRGDLAHAKVDPFSSAIAFPDWTERIDKAFLWRGPEDYDPLIVYQPRSWLLKEGWMRSKCGSSAWKTNLALDGRSSCCSCLGLGRLLDESFGCRRCRSKARWMVRARVASFADQRCVSPPGSSGDQFH
jgi:hypothetical protein